MVRRWPGSQGGRRRCPACPARRRSAASPGRAAALSCGPVGVGWSGAAVAVWAGDGATAGGGAATGCEDSSGRPVSSAGSVSGALSSPAGVSEARGLPLVGGTALPSGDRRAAGASAASVSGASDGSAAGAPACGASGPESSGFSGARPGGGVVPATSGAGGGIAPEGGSAPVAAGAVGVPAPAGVAPRERGNGREAAFPGHPVAVTAVGVAGARPGAAPSVSRPEKAVAAPSAPRAAGLVETGEGVGPPEVERGMGVIALSCNAWFIIGWTTPLRARCAGYPPMLPRARIRARGWISLCDRTTVAGRTRSMIERTNGRMDGLVRMQGISPSPAMRS